jgi:hypothetical protein
MLARSRGSEWMRLALAGACFAAVSLGAAHARADVSSWVYAGYGPSTVDDGDGYETQHFLELETGLGTPASDPFIIGGIFKFGTHFGRGTDLGLALRGATQGFQLGGFGFAVDLGAYERFWEVGSFGGQGSLVLGAPWGITMSLSGGIGTNDARHASLTFGIDFARLTVYRLSGESWFPNAYPAYRPER